MVHYSGSVYKLFLTQAYTEVSTGEEDVMQLRLGERQNVPGINQFVVVLSLFRLLPLEL